MNELQLIIRDALEFIKAAGAVGVLKSRLFDAVRNHDSSRLSPEMQDVVFREMESRGWITSHIEPVWHNRRWTLTERGLTAYEGMN